ncbi:MAG: UDP-N-acetylmuramate:L-alanyl-gamma-D-glutamyl-meso-diaminopimelate ligase [Pseudomonadota bacterium]
MDSQRPVFVAGICGTFMAGIAQIATQMGRTVSGCDEGVYPPMSSLLHSLGIRTLQGYDPNHLPNDDRTDVLIGNALSRGNPLVEATLERKLAYLSAPEWLKHNVLRNRMVVAVAGTHGKTSTSSMIAWILARAGFEPGYLIGGKPGNFDTSAALGSGPQFVIEADEYDTAFFDKRSKFVHYLPSVAVLNNLEFDHADIFADLEQIKTQFHHLLRIVPPGGHVVVNVDEPNLQSVLNRGCWSQVTRFSRQSETADWSVTPLQDDFSSFSIDRFGQPVGRVEWSSFGSHNMMNALAAVATSSICGVDPAIACEALAEFSHPSRRLQLIYDNNDVTVYEDFAHHPTAIFETLSALRHRHPGRNLIAILEPRSNTMRAGVHGDKIHESLTIADQVLIYASEIGGKQSIPDDYDQPMFRHRDSLVEETVSSLIGNDVVVLMSNGSFDEVPSTLVARLKTK